MCLQSVLNNQSGVVIAYVFPLIDVDIINVGLYMREKKDQKAV